MKKLFIIGTSDLAKESALFVEHINAVEPQWDLCGFISENADEVGNIVGLWKVIGDDQWLLSQTCEADLLIAIGHPKIRSRVVAKYQKVSHFHYPNFIHPRALLDKRVVKLGYGNMITPGCVFTCNIKISNFNYFNLNVTVGHDVTIGSYNVINPGANISGGVNLGCCILVGTGCQVLGKVRVDDNATLGAGAVVRLPVDAGQTIVGVPGRPLSR